MKKKTIKKVSTRVSKVPKTRNANSLTESQYFSKIRSMLRSGFRYWRPMQLALEKASRPSQSENKRIKKEYCCAMCGAWKKRADMEIDHVEECGSLSKFEDIVPFIQRLTKENIDAYQILCKTPCHKNKTDLYKQSKKICGKN